MCSLYSFTEYSGSEEEIETGSYVRKREYQEYGKPSSIPISFPLKSIIKSADDVVDERQNIKLDENKFDFNKSPNFKYLSPFLEAQRCECKEPLDNVTPEAIFYEVKKLNPNKSVGETFFHIACRKNLKNVCLYLIHGPEFKDNLNVKENAGYTPLHEACLANNLACAKILLMHGANPNCSLPDGTRPIHDAIDIDELDLVKMLITFGADPTFKTYAGKGSLDYAKSDTMRQFLERYIRLYDFYRKDGSSTLNQNVLEGIEILKNNKSDLVPINDLLTNDNPSILYEISDSQFPKTQNVTLNGGGRTNVVIFEKGDTILSKLVEQIDPKILERITLQDGNRVYMLHKNYAKIPKVANEFFAMPIPSFDVP